MNSKKDGAKSREMITFLVGAQEFCIDVMSVREIRVWTPATPIAHAPSYVAGVINLRGTVLPIIDFAARLGLPPDRTDHPARDPGGANRRSDRRTVGRGRVGDPDDHRGSDSADPRRRLRDRAGIRQRHRRDPKPDDQPRRARWADDLSRRIPKRSVKAWR